MKQKTITAAELLTEVIIKGLDEKKGLNIVRMDLAGLSGAVTDYFIVCTGSSDRHRPRLLPTTTMMAQVPASLLDPSF